MYIYIYLNFEGGLKKRFTVKRWIDIGVGFCFTFQPRAWLRYPATKGLSLGWGEQIVGLLPSPRSMEVEKSCVSKVSTIGRTHFVLP